MYEFCIYIFKMFIIVFCFEANNACWHFHVCWKHDWCINKKKYNSEQFFCFFVLFIYQFFSKSIIPYYRNLIYNYKQWYVMWHVYKSYIPFLVCNNLIHDSYQDTMFFKYITFWGYSSRMNCIIASSFWQLNTNLLQIEINVSNIH